MRNTSLRCLCLAAVAALLAACGDGPAPAPAAAGAGSEPRVQALTSVSAFTAHVAALPTGEHQPAQDIGALVPPTSETAEPEALR